MNASRKPESFSTFMESYMHELMSMSDEDVLEGCDVDAETQRTSRRLAAAKAEAGRRRLSAAKERMKQQTSTHDIAGAVSLDEARAFIRRAANDGQVTMAARWLSEMSEADTMRLYSQLRQLQQGAQDSEGKPE
jgi:hypothetical protein